MELWDETSHTLEGDSFVAILQKRQNTAINNEH